MTKLNLENYTAKEEKQKLLDRLNNYWYFHPKLEDS